MSPHVVPNTSFQVEKTKPDEKSGLLLSMFNAMNPLKDVAVKYNKTLQKDRRSLDIVLSLIFLAGVVLFSFYEGKTIFDENQYEGACYSTGSSSIPESSSLKVKHLCYTKEKPEYEHFAFITYTCRGVFSGEKWGVLSNDLNGGSKTVVAFDTQPEFCAQVISSAESELRPFVSSSSQQGCHGGGCRNDLDKSKTYTFQGDSKNEKYWAVEGSQSELNQFTCCGMRVLGNSDRALLYIAAIGGFAAILRTVVQCVPFCGKKSSSS